MYDEIPEDFKALVEKDSHGEQLTDEERTRLHSSENMELWRECLVSTKKDIEVQMSQRKSELYDYQQECYEGDELEGKRKYFKAKAKHEFWKKRALFFQSKVDQRLARIKSIRREAGGTTGEFVALLVHASSLISNRWGEGRNWHAHLNLMKQRYRELRVAFGDEDE